MAPGMTKCIECEMWLSWDEVSYGHDCEVNVQKKGSPKYDYILGINEKEKSNG